MKTPIALLLPAAVIAALLAACGPKSPPPEGEHPGAVKAPPDAEFGEKPPGSGPSASPAASTPAGIDWLLVSVGETPIAVQASSPAGLRLEPSTSEASGRAVCNQFKGHFDLDAAGLRFGPLATTRMACRGGAMEQETKYLKALQETSRWSREGERLILSDAGGKPLLVFVAKAGD